MKYIWIGISLVTIVVIVYFISSKNKSSSDHSYPKETPYPEKTVVIVDPTTSPTYPIPSQTPFITSAPTTMAPTSAPTTMAPTTSPTTMVPTTTMAPTAAPTPSQTPFITSAPTPSQTPFITSAPTPSQTPFITSAPTPSQTPFFPTRPVPTTMAPTAAPTAMAPTAAPTTMAPTAAPTTMAPTAAPTTMAPTAAPTTVAPAAAPLNWTPYGATIFTSPTESSFQVGACDENGVQYRQTISGSPTLTEYMICANRAGPTFGGIWDTCIIRGINYGPVTITDQYGGADPTIKAGTAITDANGTTKPFPTHWSTPTLIRNDVRNVQNCRIRAFDIIENKGNYAINDYIGQVVIYYNRGERVAIRIGTQGSNFYLSRNLNKLNQGYTTITGNIHNNITTSTSPIVLNVVSDGSLY